MFNRVESLRPQVTTSAIDFSHMARSLNDACRHCGLVAPNFRAPPSVAGPMRTVRRQGETCTVAVIIRGRSHVDVLNDMIAGVMVANQLIGKQRHAAHKRLSHELASLLSDAA